ncbi:histone-lysine N-methyltransferase 2D isoform X4 [Brienomyrus brachyistius]|uniref:histone-lysine N-methyltransferase 2D isoform X4 n=1 Tax=Brienomyrus brachyistius TaxID=42636 RepID=UPI0020B36D23|nr:histone-lysine N-methyltransferase 2D isoform X4 [Brienomyrus brachyistius]
MDEQKSNCEENDSEAAADDNVSPKGSVLPAEEYHAPSPREETRGASEGTSHVPSEAARTCALCGCAERSLHGQRELRRFSAAPGQLPLEAQGAYTPEPGTDDLSSMGFPDGTLAASLFDSAGHCWVHHWCAMWSDGVRAADGEELEGVEKAIISGIEQRCEYCNRLGATIRCQAGGCSRFYHFPCSAASGSFQSMKLLALLCVDHIDLATEIAGEEARCAVCDSAGELPGLLFCTGCGQHYHAGCLEISATPLQRSGWQCPECKVCQTCRQPGEDSMMLVCEACDKGYHTFCLQPAMDSLPSDPWKCRRCRICSVCGARGLSLPCSTQWFENYTVCDSCQPPLAVAECAVCGRQAGPSAVLHRCSVCHRMVHLGCASPSDSPEDKYTCSLCREPPLPPAQEVVVTPTSPAGQTAPEAETPSEARDSAAPPAQEGTETGVSAEPETPMEEESPLETPGGSAEQLPVLAAAAETTGDEPSEAVAQPPQDNMDPQTLGVADEEMDSGEQEKETQVQASSVSAQEEEESSFEGVCTSQASPLAARCPVSPPRETQEAEPVTVVREKCESTEPTEVEPRTNPLTPQVEAPSADMDTRANQVEEDEEEEEEEEVEELGGTKQDFQDELKIKQEQELLEIGAKQDLLLDEMSNMSHGDGSSSGFLGSPEEAELQTHSAELSLVPAGRPRSDSLLTETDDSLPFDPLKPDGDKIKRRGSPGRSRVKQGRSSSFPGKRRPRGGGSGRGRGRSRLKAMASCIDAFLLSMTADTALGKDEEEEEDDTMQNTVVLFSSTDKFVLLQDMCVVCGSFGRGAEGQLLACAQCAQCYHPYCVNSKITKMMLYKGWRCLECIVCEVCGKASDPARLLLCDDCDISYHTYCLDPPLQTVPKGGWKCKWCVYCMQCGARSPGFHCEWQNNYTHCGPCASLVTCPVCRENFMEEELLLQCQHCDRWVHAVCEGLYTEDEVEQASDEGFACSACSPFVPKPVVVETPIVPAVKIKEPEPQIYRLEGVWLTEAGMSVLRSISMSPLQKRRQRRSRSGPFGLEAGEGEQEEARGGGEPMECGPKPEAPGSPEREGGPDRDLGPEDGIEAAGDGDGMKGVAEEADDGKKRKRKPYRPGIGGFMVRQRKCNFRAKKGLIQPPVDVMVAEGQPPERTAEEASHPDTPVEVPPEAKAAEIEGDQAKKRRGRKKSKLEDMFPVYLQEAFFGKTLLDLSKKALQLPPGQKQTQPAVRLPRPAASATVEPGAQVVAPDSEETKEDCDPLLKKENGCSVEALAAGAGAAGPSPFPKDQTASDSQAPGAVKPEGLPQGVESQDTEQFFRKVLGVTECASVGGTLQGDVASIMEPVKVELSRSGLPQRGLPPGASLPGSLPSAGVMETFPPLSQSSYFDVRDRGELFSPDQGDESPWAAPSTPATPPTPTEPEGDGLSYNQRSLQRWEKDEELGELSTISPVLYANINFPHLKQDYPDWTNRCKQIMKIWRKVLAADKVPFLQKAKDNRAAQRINKAQKAEVQVARPVKTEAGRPKDRPHLHLQIPPPSGFLSTPSQPSSAEMPYPIPSDSGTSAALYPEGAFKVEDLHTDSLAKLPPPSPCSHSQPSTPYSQPASNPLMPPSSHAHLSMGAPQGRPPSLGSVDMHPGTPGTPNRVDPFCRHQPQQGHPLHSLQQAPQEALGPPESTFSKASGPGDSPLLLQTHSSHFGDPVRRQEYGSAPSPAAASSSPAGAGQHRPDFLGVPSPRSSSAVRQDLGSGSPAGMLEAGDGLFKAPLTPRNHQGDAAGVPGFIPPSASPNQALEGYRQSPSTPFSDPYAQPPLTPRPPSRENCPCLPSRPLPALQDSCSRVPSSPQSQGSSQSPLSNDAFSVQSPRFQSPSSPYSRPPSRPQSRDPFASLHKPPRPSSATPEGSPAFRASPQLGQQLPLPPPSPALVDPLSGKPAGSPSFNRSPNMAMFPGTQSQVSMPFGECQPPQPQSHPTTDTFPARMSLPPGMPDSGSPRVPDTAHVPNMAGTQELPDISVSQDPGLIGLSPSELEKHRQRQRLRELLKRQQMQRNSLRQEKEAASANGGASSWPGGEMAHYQQDTSQRAPPPYPQDRLGAAPGAAPLMRTVPPAIGSVDSKLNCPPPSGTPTVVDPTTFRPPGPSNPQGLYPRLPFHPQWQRQATALRRFPPPSSVEAEGSRHHPGAPVNHPLNLPAGMQALGTSHAPGPGQGGEALQNCTPRAPLQFIELRHNSQRMPVGPQFSPRGPQPRPRVYMPQQDMGAPFMQRSLPLPTPSHQPQTLPPTLSSLAEGTQDPRLGMQQDNLAFVPPQKITPQALMTPQNPNPETQPGTHQPVRQAIPLGEPKAAPVAIPARACTLDIAEPDMEDPFVPKELAGPGDEEDDLPPLDLDPDKGDDDLGNLDNLETADPHLDDLLKCDEFDILAYTDPELDQGDPKDVFSDQLTLVEAEIEVPGPSSTAAPNIKVEGKSKLGLSQQDPRTASTSSGSVAPSNSGPSAPSSCLSVRSGPSGEPVIKLEDAVLGSGLTGSQAPTCCHLAEADTRQPGPSGVGEAASVLLPETTTTTKPPNTQSTNSASLSSVRIGGIPYSLPDHLSFPSAPTNTDLDEDPLGLPGGSGQHSPSVDLKVESSLEESELPLLIQDLLEHEKKELQKQQQLSSFQQAGMNTHIHGLPPQDANQGLLSQHQCSPPQGLMGQAGMVPRPPHMLSPQQQRMLGTQMTAQSHMAMAQQQAMIRAGQSGGILRTTNPPPPQQPVTKQAQVPDNFYQDKDLEKFAADDIMDPIAKAKMVALKGIKRVMAQGSIGVPPGINRQQVSLLAQKLGTGPSASDTQGRMHTGLANEGESSDPMQCRPNPPQFVQGIINDTEQHQYEEWLLHTQQLLQMQLKFLEEQIGVHRKSRKALCAKQRTAKKAGREFAEADAEKLKLVTEQQSKIQKQLDQVRKQQKEHTNLMAEYRSKQQQHQHQQGSALLAPSPTTQGPRMLSKLPGQMVMGQQGAPMMGQQSICMPVRSPGQAFPMGSPPGTSSSFFPQGSGAHVPDARQLQLQHQHRMQMVQKLQQQQGMMAQQPILPQQPGMLSQQQGSLVGQPQQGMMGSHLTQQQPAIQPGMMGNQQGQTGQMQAPQGMIMEQAIAHAQSNMLAGQQTVIGNQAPLQHKQSPQVLIGQQGAVDPQQQVFRGPQASLTPQQQMVLSQQQPTAVKNPLQLHPVQHRQFSQGFLNQNNPQPDLGNHPQPALPQVGRSPADPQQLGGPTPQSHHSRDGSQLQGPVDALQHPQEVQTSGSKQAVILSPRTPPQQQGAPTPIPIQHPGAAGEQQHQQTHVFMAQQQQAQQIAIPSPLSGAEQQQSYLSNVQAAMSSQVQQQQLPLQRQSSVEEKLVTVKQEGQSMCYMTQQQESLIGQQPREVMGQQHEAMGQLQGMSQSDQAQKNVLSHPSQQQVLLAQQQKQAMNQMGMIRGPRGLMGQRPGMPLAQPRATVNLQALIAQNPQLRHLPPQQIQAMIAQRQLQHNQMLRMSANQGQPLGPVHLQGQQDRPQQLPTHLLQHGSLGQQGAVGSPRQPVMMDRFPGMAPQLQRGAFGPPQQPPPSNMMVESQKQHQMNPSPQHGPSHQHSFVSQQQSMLQQQQMARGQTPVSLSSMGQGHVVPQVAMSPHQALKQNSPGDPSAQLHSQVHPMGIHQPSPTQTMPCRLASKPLASSPFQACPATVGSPAGLKHSASPDLSLLSAIQKQESNLSTASNSKPDMGKPPVPAHVASPKKYSQASGMRAFSQAAEPRDSPLSGANGSNDSAGLKPDPQTSEKLSNNGTSLIQVNGPACQSGENSQHASPQNQLPQQAQARSGEALCRMTLENIKQEPREMQCDTRVGEAASTGGIKREANVETLASRGVTGLNTISPENPALPSGPHVPRTETGQQLLQKLLRTKNLQLAAQRSSDDTANEMNGHINSKLAMLEQKLQGAPPSMEDLQSISKKAPPPKAKRTAKAGERVPNSRKKTKKEDVGRSAEALMKQLKQESLKSLLPLMEPSITASLDLFAPFGSGPASGKAQLKGSFGNAVLDNIPDYYSQLLAKNNLSNPPTPPSSLPPTPPPSVQHKMLNGVTAVEELTVSRKDAEGPEENLRSAAEEVKGVDLLAALPTPPHNQNEDIRRMESDEDSDASEGIVPPSSPESVLGDEAQRFPLLREPKLEEDERAISPIIPLIPQTSIPVFPENKPLQGLSVSLEHGGKVTPGAGSWDKAKGREVSVTFTVSAAAAKNLSTVMVAVAQLLQMRMPASYEVAFPQSPGRAGNGEQGSAPDATTTAETPCQNPESADWLKQFDVSLPGCTLKKPVDILSLIKQEDEEQGDKPVQHCYSTNVSDLDVRHLPIFPAEASPPPSPSPPPPPPPPPGLQDLVRSAFPLTSSPLTVNVKSEPEQDPILQPLLSLPTEAVTPQVGASPIHDSSPKTCKQRSRPLPEECEEARPKEKKWKGLRWKRLQLVIAIRKGGSRKESSREVSELMERLRITLRPDKLPRDRRKCCFCHEEGDGATDGPARLLNIDVDLWVHLNCALWSTEVYETQGGALINVEVALRRGLRTRCTCCQKTGATNSCNRLRCPNVYHFACAIRARCMFFKDKTMLCTQHKLKGPSEEELSNFAVFRRVYIERDDVKQIACILQRGDRVHMFRVGGLIFHSVGHLLPSQMVAFHSPTAIFPVGYEATRIYWSTRVPNRRCRYRCRIGEADGRPLFEVRVLEQGQEDLHFRDSTPDGIWSCVVEQVAKLRQEASMLKLFTEHVKGEEMYGLTLHAVLRITESLPGVESCQNYVFRYGRHPLMELPLMINPTGCARSEPKSLTHCKRPHTLNSTSMSKAYQSTFTGEINTPYSKQFVHSKSSQYRRLKTEWKNNVYLARSRIQGLGLYAAKDLEKHTMVIEYIGTIIRNEVANRREKVYEEQNRGIYMFRINNEHVIDATLTGGPARYVNHSCAPNCVAEVVTFDKEDKIIIISSRRIPKGEELTYDYQFDFEDDQHKIPCHCGAWNCRKWMN